MAVAVLAERAAERERVRREDASRETDSEIVKALGHWHRERRDCGLNCIDTTHVCSLSCMRSGSIQCIDNDIDLFGCFNSGLHHHCKKCIMQCRIHYCQGDGAVCCTFSGFFIEQDVSRELYPQGPKHGDGVLLGSDDETEGIDIDYSEEEADAAAGGGDEEEEEEGAPATDKEIPVAAAANRQASSSSSWDNVWEVVAEEARRKKPRYNLPIGDDGKAFGMPIVSMDTLRQQEERETFRTTVISGEFVAQTRDEEEEEATATDTQPPTKRQRTETAVHACLLTSDTVTVIEKIVENLFDRVQRLELSEAQLRDMNAATESEIQKYFKRCKRDSHLANIHAMDAIFDHNMNRKRQLTVDPLDRQQRTRYVAAIYETWRVLIETPYFAQMRSSDLRVQDHTLAMLYMMRQPVDIATRDGGVSLLPRDAFLDENLPAQSLLAQWNAARVPAAMRRATNNRTRRRRRPRMVSAGAAGGGYSKSAISRGRKHISLGLSSIAGGEKRDQIVQRIQHAYREGVYENDFYLKQLEA